MAQTDPAPEGATNDRPKHETLAETGPGVPDEAIGPDQMSVPDELELSESPEARRIEQKLRAEALARSAGDDAAADPSGHA